MHARGTSRSGRSARWLPLLAAALAQPAAAEDSGQPDDVAEPAEPSAASEPAGDASARVVAVLAGIEETLVETRYQHRTVVSERRGRYLWDCSGMAAWVLERAAPAARRRLSDDHPTAREFHDVIAEAPADEPRRGWRRLARPEEIRPGDLFAWRKPDFWAHRPNTGHVGFVREAPRPHPSHANVWTMRVADATAMRHEADSRPEGGEGGYGTATMAFLFDEEGTGIAYGWYGEGQDPATFVPTTIVFGRVAR